MREIAHAKSQSRQAASHKLSSVWCWSGFVLTSIPIHWGFVAYLFLAHGKRSTNNIYITYHVAWGSFSSFFHVRTVFGLEATLGMSFSQECSYHESLNRSHSDIFMIFSQIVQTTCAVCQSSHTMEGGFCYKLQWLTSNVLSVSMFLFPQLYLSFQGKVLAA